MRQRSRVPILTRVAVASLVCLTAAFGLGSSGAAARTSAKAAALPNMAYVRAQVNGALSPNSPFVAPGPSFKARKVRGKSLFYIPLTTDIPSTEIIMQSAHALANRLGIHFVAYPTNGTPTEWIQGFNEAIAQKPNVLFMTANFLLLGPQIAQARAAGIKVVDGRNIDENEPTPPGINAIVGSPHIRAAQLEADYITLHSHGHAHVLIITSNENHVSPEIVAAMQNEYARRCGPGCTTTVVNVPVVKWATDIQGTVASTLTQDPSINYVDPIYDGMVPFTIAGLTTSGALGRVKIVTYNGTPSVLALVASGQVLMDVGEDFHWDAYAQMDQIMRVMLGLKPVKAEHTTLRIWDKSNIAQAGSPPVIDQGYSKEFYPGYSGVWELKLTPPRA